MNIEITDTPPLSKTPIGNSLHDCVSLTIEHIDAVEHLSQAVWDDLEANGHKDFVSRKHRHEFEDYLVSGRSMGIFVFGQVIGFGYLGRTSTTIPDDGVPGMAAIYDPQNTAVLRTALVHPEYQRRGLGLLLVKERIALARRLGHTAVVSGASSPNTKSWHNLLRAAMRLVQVGDLPPSISADSRAKAFYFHKDLVEKPAMSFSRQRIIDPIEEYDLLRSLLDRGWINTASKSKGNKMLLILSKHQE